MGRENDKALRYIEALDTARCSGRWREVPELARKVEKHAPHRACLTLVARTEAEINGVIASGKATTTGSDRSSDHLASLTQPLQDAVAKETEHPEDAFQGQVCLGWLRWECKDYNAVATTIPVDIPQILAKLGSARPSTGTPVQVSGLRGIYLRGFAQEKLGAALEGLRTYRTAVPYLLSAPSLGSTSPEFRLWAERLLARTVSTSMSAVASSEFEDFDSLLRIFHLWVPLSAPSPSRLDLGPDVEFSRWDFWLAYYRILSTILQRNLLYSSSYTDLNPMIVSSAASMSYQEYCNARIQQRAELKRVEANIETKLTEETRFPKSNERNERTEIWVDAVMQNWYVMCGPSWNDDGLGEGGKNAIARGVLDILYRAATKSFQSTQILRHLFTVHSYLTEFDLAIRAFQSYIEIVQRGKDRAEKSGEIDYSLDSDDLVLTTAAEAILVFCKFGSHAEAENARVHADRIQKWLSQHSVHQQKGDIEIPGGTSEMEPHPNLSIRSKTISQVYHALGVAAANWATWTSEASTRNVHQANALKYLQIALSPELHNTSDSTIAFSYAIILAESRDIAGAIKVVKKVLSTASNAQSRGFSANHDASSIAEANIITQGPIDQHHLTPFWHLLTLLLTSKSDYSHATGTIEAAFEQLDTQSDVPESRNTYRSEHLQDERSSTVNSAGVFDSISPSEKATIIEAKLTQLALIESVDGATAAVDSSAELLGLFTRFFGNPRAEIARAPSTAALKPPRTAMGSVRHSIISRARSRRRADSPAIDDTTSVRPSTRATTRTAAPTINVTDEDATSPVYSDEHNPSARGRQTLAIDGRSTPVRRPSSKLQKRNSSRARSRDSFRPGSAHAGPIPIVDATAVNDTNRTESRSDSRSLVSRHRPTTSTTATPSIAPTEKANGHSAEQPLKQVPSNMPDEKALPGQLDGRESRWQDTRLPAPHPSSPGISPQPRFSELQERRRKITLLVEVWLFIAGLYVRAGMLDDAGGAIDEAASLVLILEAEVARENSSAESFAKISWGAGKSIENLWADVWTQRGERSLAAPLPIEALSHFEKALAHYPDHPTAIVHLSTLLLDIYEEKIPFEIPEYPPLTTTSSSKHPTASATSTSESTSINGAVNGKIVDSPPPMLTTEQNGSDPASTTPEGLNRLAARDRAYMLLSTLTKMGSGWDGSEAWFALARAYELSGQIGKAKDVLWWCVELEDSRPIRGWRCVTGGYVL